ncbi:MAG TPA: FAD-dependent oxidoreductase [Candidatus Binataceae bacterium]|nr:FAD-dependent oxidoreductase [Candidatus Binataceae bacterium]
MTPQNPDAANQPQTRDSIRVIVVGAGVVGCSIAMHLARAGAQVQVFDKSGMCSGMSARSGALVRMHYTFAPEADLAWKSLRYFQNWSEMIGGESGFTGTGFAMIVDDQNVAALRANVKMLQGLGIDTDVISAEELHRIDPNVNLEGVAMAAYEPQSGYADPVATTIAMADAAKRAGAEFHLNTPIESVRARAARVFGVLDAAGRFHEADAVCLVTGPWTEGLLTPFGAKIGITPERAQIAFFKRTPSIQHLTYIDTIAGSYFRPHATDLTLAGLGALKLDESSPDSFREANDPEFIEAVRKRLGARIPALASAAYVRGHAGIYDVTPDQRPVLDEIAGVSGLFVAAGFSGTGFKTSPAVGAAMSELIKTGASTTADLSPFSYIRFLQRKLIRSEHEYTMGANFGHTL